MKVIIVGGVAGGASCAARLRRLDEKAEILMVERGPYVSYANCGLPYHVGGVIPEESSLLVATEQTFRGMFDVEVRTGCEAVSISPKKKTVDLRNVATGEVTTESYDKLVLSPGAAPIRPPLPGIDLPGIFSVRTVPDARTIRQWLERGTETRTGLDSYTGLQVVTKPKRAVVVGGGFIGLEMVENFAHLGLEVTLVEKLDQVMPPLDPEMARLVERYMVKHGVQARAQRRRRRVPSRPRTARSRSSRAPGRPTRRTSWFSRSACGRRRRSPRRPGSSSASAEASASTSTCARATPTSSPSATRSR